MEFIFELLFALLVDGSVEASKNKKIPKFVRYLLMFILLLIFMFVIGSIFYFGYFSLIKGKVSGGIALIVISLVLMFSSIFKLIKIGNSKGYNGVSMAKKIVNRIINMISIVGTILLLIIAFFGIKNSITGLNFFDEHLYGFEAFRMTITFFVIVPLFVTWPFLLAILLDLIINFKNTKKSKMFLIKILLLLIVLISFILCA